MEENLKNAEPQADEKTANKIDSTEIFIPIKFNKEEKMLSVAEAAELAQKGMKLDYVSEILEELKLLCRESGKSVTRFLNELKAEKKQKRMQELMERCGGNEELAQHIIELEGYKSYQDELGFDEISKNFPKIKSPEQLPVQVLDAAKLKGTLLLDEYLRFLLADKKRAEEAAKAQKNAELLSTGSQLNKKGKINPETAEFLKGLWK